MAKRKTRTKIWNSALVAAIVGAILGAIAGGLVNFYIEQERQLLTSYEEGKIREIIEQEANFVLEGKIDEVVLLFDEKAFVRDAAGGHIDQEIIWNGRKRISERYRNLPEFIYLKHEAIEITMSSDKTYARVIADTLGIYSINGTEVKISSNRGEKWTFEKNGEWKITSFTYNLP